MEDEQGTLTAAPQMPDAYHKARRAFALYSSILLAWEYIGLNVGDKAKPLNWYEVPVTKTQVSISNPEVIPVVIMFLVLYFALRFTIELFRIDAISRKAAATQVDVWIAYGLGALALVVFVLQNTFDFRIADVFSMEVSIAAPYGMLFGGALYYGGWKALPEVRAQGDVVSKLVAGLGFWLFGVPSLLAIPLMVSYTGQRIAFSLVYFTGVVVSVCMSHLVVRPYLQSRFRQVKDEE